jgi:hypothetical protein
MMEDLVYEWRQYDSDLVPDEYFGPLTKERRARWYDFRERKSSVPCERENFATLTSLAEGYIAFPAAKLPLLDKSLSDRDWWKLSPPRSDQLMALPEGKKPIVSSSSFLIHVSSGPSSALRRLHVPLSPPVGMGLQQYPGLPAPRQPLH